MKKLFVILPCYNESGNIGALLEDWLALEKPLYDAGYSLMLCGLDDKSTDNTRQIITSYAKKYKAVHLIWHTVNKNLGGGLRTAFCFFDRHGAPGDLCVIMDGDHTQSPAYIMDMLRALTPDTDCVIASRYQKGAKVYGVPGYRLLLSDGAYVFYSAVLRIPHVRDYTCGYRVYRYEIIHRARAHYGKHLIEMNSFSCMLEVLYKLHLIGAKFREIPFTLHYEYKQGSSKMRVFRTVYDSVSTVVRLRWMQ